MSTNEEFTFNSRGTQVPAGHWFTLDILATDNSQTAFVNGKLSSQIVSNSRVYPTGHIALQQKTPETVIEFRTIAIKEYDPQAQAAPNEVARLVGHSQRVASLAFSSHGARLLTGGDTRRVWQGGTQYGSNTIRLWDVASGQNTRTFPGNEPFVTGTAFSPEDKLVATCGGWWDPPNENFKVIDLITGRMDKLKREAKAGLGVAQAVSFTRDGRRVLAAYANGTVQPWELETKERLPLIRLKAGECGIEEFPALLFTSDQKRLATGSLNGPVELWDLATGARRAVFAGHAGAVVALARSPDDRLILSGGADGMAILWDVAGEKRLRVLDCKVDGLHRVALSPNGRLAVTGGQYGDLRLWDLATGREVERFEGHTMGVNALAFSPDGRLVASASDDMTARLWRLPEAVGR